MANLLSRILQPLLGKAAVEGQSRPGPYFLPVTGGWLPAAVGDNLNWWQMGYNVEGYSPSALVEACISAYAQTVAMCPGDHWLSSDDGGRKRVPNSALARILRKPNAYQSISDFMLNTVHNLYSDGNAYALALRNNRYEINELHLMRSQQCYPQVSVDGEVFYHLGGNDIINRMAGGAPLLVPARDVLHIRLNTRRNTLLGESPLIAAMQDVATNDIIVKQQIQFYLNQARPSQVLQTDMVLDRDQVAALRDRWNEQSRGMNSGGTPILTAGLKVQTVSTTARDAEMAELLKMSRDNIALAFRVPLQILGLGGNSGGGGPSLTTEILMQSWIASGLGFCLNHVEEAMGNLFGLYGYPDEYVEFNTSSLLRSAFKDRIDSLSKAVQGGIFSPNEARASEAYPAVKFGDEPRVQQQVVPLSAAAGIPSAPAPGSAPPAPAPKPAPKIPSKVADDTIKRAARQLISRSDRRDRRTSV